MESPRRIWNPCYMKSAHWRMRPRGCARCSGIIGLLRAFIQSQGELLGARIESIRIAAQKFAVEFPLYATIAHRPVWFWNGGQLCSALHSVRPEGLELTHVWQHAAAREIMRLQDLIRDIFVKQTGQSVEKVTHDMDRDYFMTSEQAKEYGIIDEILVKPTRDVKAKK